MVVCIGTRLTNPDRHETTKQRNHEKEDRLGFRGFVVSCVCVYGICEMTSSGVYPLK